MADMSDRRRKFRIFSAVWPAVLIILSSALLTGADSSVIENTTAKQREQWYQEHVHLKQKSPFTDLIWQFMGPTNISGRMTDVAVVAPKGKHYTLYVAGASGGVWKTDNEGTTWEPVFEHAMSTSIGDIAVAPSNQDIIWVGTGEANIFRSSMAGAGVYRSTDGGDSWQHMGLTATHTIARIVIHPQDPGILYVAASGHEWTRNDERGVYRTVDGGESWEKVLFIDSETGAIDLVMDPRDPQTLYAATWQRTRKKWNDPRNTPDHRGSSIYKTVDGGVTWTETVKGLPEPQHRGRIGIDLCAGEPDTLYAFVDHYEVVDQWDEDELDSYGRPKGGVIRGATVFRSDDAGSTWRQVSEDNEFMRNLSGTYGWVFGQIRVDPKDENTIYVMGLGLNVSTDGGRTFKTLRGMHGDHHGLWIDPENTDYLVNVNDGGVAISYDGGENWRTFYNNLPLVQFFNVAADMGDPVRIYGSIQDHGSFRGVLDLSRGRHHIPAVEWERAPGGEGSSHAIDPEDPDTVYSAGFYGTITRTNMKTGQTVSLVPRAPEGEEAYRGQWVAPFIISPHNPFIIYHGMNYLFRSMNRGHNWERISPDLTGNRDDMKGDIPYQTIFTISESPFQFGLIYAGTDDGMVHVTRDGGRTWKEITSGLPSRKWVSRIVASAHDRATVYMTQNGKRDDDFAAYVWKSTDYGEHWTDISSNIPCGPVNVIREDPVNSQVLYLGTDLGVYVTIDGGKTWNVLGGGLPTTFVHDLVVHPRENVLIAATHGRGMWVLDVRYLQWMTEEVTTSRAHIFPVDDAILPQWRWWRWGEGRNAYLFYYVNESSPLKLMVRDHRGQLVKSWQEDPVKGINLVVWDLRPGSTSERTAQGRDKQFVAAGQYDVLLLKGRKVLARSQITISK